MTYIYSQAEGGVMCPMAMAYSVIPCLAMTPEVEAEWLPRLMSNQYDRRDIPATEKTGALKPGRIRSDRTAPRSARHVERGA